MTLEEVKIEASKLGYNLIPKKPKSIPKLPCICGRKNIDTWYSGLYGCKVRQYVCPKCGRKTDFFVTDQAVRVSWNKMIQEELFENADFKQYVGGKLNNSDPEPICPFIFSGFCNDAYSNRCYRCEHAVKDYLKVDDRV